CQLVGTKDAFEEASLVAARLPREHDRAELRRVDVESFRHAARLPDHPGRLIRSPELLELILLAERVHRLPKAGMGVGHELSAAGELRQRLGLPRGLVATDQLDAPRGQHEEASVDEASTTTRLLDEARHLGSVHLEPSVASRWLYGGDRCELSVLAVESQLLGDIDVRDAVAVREAEGVFVFHVLDDALEPATGHALLAGVDERDLPRLGLAAVHFH